MAARVRVRHMQVFLDQAEQTPGLSGSLRSALSAEDLAAIDESPGVGWLPVEVNVRVTHATMELLSDSAAEAFFRSMMLQDFEKPFLKPVVKLATGLFGVDVGSFVKLVPRGWSQVFDGTGRLEVGEGGARFAVLDFLETAPVLVGDGGRWAQSVCWSLTSLLAVAKREGTVSTEAFEPDQGWIRYRFEWT